MKTLRERGVGLKGVLQLAGNGISFHEGILGVIEAQGYKVADDGVAADDVVVGPRDRNDLVVRAGVSDGVMLDRVVARAPIIVARCL